MSNSDPLDVSNLPPAEEWFALSSALERRLELLRRKAPDRKFELIREAAEALGLKPQSIDLRLRAYRWLKNQRPETTSADAKTLKFVVVDRLRTLYNLDPAEADRLLTDGLSKTGLRKRRVDVAIERATAFGKSQPSSALRSHMVLATRQRFAEALKAQCQHLLGGGATIHPKCIETAIPLDFVAMRGKQRLAVGRLRSAYGKIDDPLIVQILAVALLGLKLAPRSLVIFDADWRRCRDRVISIRAEVGAENVELFALEQDDPPRITDF
jgi:hypothetical protein